MIRRRQAQLSIDDLLAFGPHRSARELLSPRMRGIDEALDDSALVDEVYSIFAERHPDSRGNGRPGTPAEVVLRLLVLKHLKDWSYEELEWEVRGSLAYRYFCRIGMGKVPDEKTMVRVGQLFEGEALRVVFDRVVSLAVKRKVTRGRRMRVDSTVVEAPIRPPTDSRLCEDAVRVTRRSVRKLEEAGVKLPFARARIRTALMRRVREIAQNKRLARKKPEALKRPYRGLLSITRKALKQARTAVTAATAQVKRRRGPKRRMIQREVAKLEQFIELGQQVVKQTRNRVLGGNTRSEGKLISIFEPTAQILRRGKPHRPTEFGQLVDVFGKPPHLVAADRGYYSARGVEGASELGAGRVAVPKPGSKSQAQTQYERQRWFRRGHRWRTGGEARISRLKNTFGMRRTRYRGACGIERTATWAAIANNLTAIAFA